MEDKRPFARIMYASRLSLESGDDVLLREKYAWELLKTTNEQEYDKRQKKFILEFADRVFWVKGFGISENLKEAYKMQTISLEEYSKKISEEVAKMEGKERRKTIRLKFLEEIWRNEK
ncbi:hypothetical protein FACS1894187_21610 [Synergistales bacterium]|nr:hypothetical protein FACS1894187_21610 [Synergistales bacterium]